MSSLSTSVLTTSARPSSRHAGGMPRLIAADAGLRRHLLDYADRMAAALAQRLVEREQTDPLCVGTLADALLHVFVRAVDRFGIEAEAQTNALSMDTLR